MTLRPSSPRAKPRWLTLFVLVVTLTVAGGALVLGHGATSIPARYAGGTQVDIDPPPGPAVNDVPGQVDMTQMGRDTSANPDVRIFWSWDSISAWTGNGQTGDACALFDTADTDAFINYVVCARVQNNGTPGDVILLPASANHPVYLFDCSNKKNDRCTNPAPRNYGPGGVLAGPLTEAGALSQTGAGDLITETDPFNATFSSGPGESYPHDTSIEILVDDSLVPTDVRLANVCSYPSAGNGGNNNPFDCVVTPGVQFGTLRVTKVVTNDNGGTATAPNFSYSVDGGTQAAFPAGGTIDIQVSVGNHSVTETTIATGYTASYANSVNSNTNCTNLAVTAGQVTTCTITNNDQAPSLTLVKTITNDSGGTAAATDWTLRANKTGTDTTTYELSGTTPVASGASFVAGTYDLSETAAASVLGGYTASAWSCVKNGGAAVEGSSITLTITDTATCTINNNDNIATPQIATVMKWTLNDRTVMTGWITGGGASTVTFSLYKDSGTNVSCEPGTLVTTFTENVVDANGSAATTGGYTTEVHGTYHWIATFNGNSRNASISSNCADETTVLP